MCPVTSFLGRVLAPSASSTCSLQCPDRKVLDPRVPSPQHTALAVPTEHGHVGGDLALPGVLNRQLWGPHPKPSQRQATTPVHLGNTPSAGQLHPSCPGQLPGQLGDTHNGGMERRACTAKHLGREARPSAHMQGTSLEGRLQLGRATRESTGRKLGDTSRKEEPRAPGPRQGKWHLSECALTLGREALGLALGTETQHQDSWDKEVPRATPAGSQHSHSCLLCVPGADLSHLPTHRAPRQAQLAPVPCSPHAILRWPQGDPADRDLSGDPPRP